MGRALVQVAAAKNNEAPSQKCGQKCVASSLFLLLVVAVVMKEMPLVVGVVLVVVLVVVSEVVLEVVMIVVVVNARKLGSQVHLPKKVAHAYALPKLANREIFVVFI